MIIAVRTTGKEPWRVRSLVRTKATAETNIRVTVIP